MLILITMSRISEKEEKEQIEKSSEGVDELLENPEFTKHFTESQVCNKQKQQKQQKLTKKKINKNKKKKNKHFIKND